MLLHVLMLAVLNNSIRSSILLLNMSGCQTTTCFILNTCWPYLLINQKFWPQILFSVTAPTSFEGPIGKISYCVKAAIDTPRFSKDYKAQRPFYLLNLLNLNEVPNIDVSIRSTNLPSLQSVCSCLSRNSLCSNQVSLWPLRSSTTCWCWRGRWCSKPAVTWGATSPVRSSSWPLRSTTSLGRTRDVCWPASYRSITLWNQSTIFSSVQFMGTITAVEGCHCHLSHTS